MATTISELVARLSLDGRGFATGAQAAGAQAESMVSRMNRNAKSVLTLGGTLETASKGFGMLKGVMGGFGIGLAGELIPTIVSGVRSLFGYSAAAEKATEETNKLIDALRAERDLFGKSDADIAEYKIRQKAEELYKETLGVTTKAQLATLVAAQASLHARIAEARGIADTIAALKAEAKAREQAAQIVAGLEEQVALYGKTTEQIKLYKLAQLGASQETLAQAEALTAELAVLRRREESLKAVADAQKRMQEETRRAADEIFKATRTPLEQYEAKLTELSELLGKGAIDWDTYGRAVKGAAKDLTDALSKEAPAAPKLIREGSAESFRSDNRANGQIDAGAKKIVEQLDKQLLQQDKQVRLLGELVTTFQVDPNAIDVSTEFTF